MKRFFSLRRNRAALRRLARRLGANRSGIAAVEFAFVLPIMLLIYFGTVELGQGVMVERKITALARAVGDLTAQSRSVKLTDTEFETIFDAADTVMMPYTEVAPSMIVSSVVIDGAGVAKVCWSKHRNGTALPKGNVSVPAAMRVPKTSFIMATAAYDFTPVIGYVVTGTIRITGGPFFMRPRTGKAGGPLATEQLERDGEPMC
jgi:Flp pilus assembly protein TadG